MCLPSIVQLGKSVTRFVTKKNKKAARASNDVEVVGAVEDQEVERSDDQLAIAHLNTPNLPPEILEIRSGPNGSVRRYRLLRFTDGETQLSTGVAPAQPLEGGSLVPVDLSSHPAFSTASNQVPYTVPNITPWRGSTPHEIDRAATEAANHRNSGQYMVSNYERGHYYPRHLRGFTPVALPGDLFWVLRRDNVWVRCTYHSIGHRASLRGGRWMVDTNGELFYSQSTTLANEQPDPYEYTLGW